MHIVPLIIIGFYFLIFLFVFYVLTVDDFVLFKKHITIETMFNLAFIAAVVSLLSARIFYVVFNFSSAYFNPLVFFLFPYFPGLSMGGAILGGAAYIVYYCKAEKLPLTRVSDFFALSFLASFPLKILVQIIGSKKLLETAVLAFGIVISYSLFALFVLAFQKKKLKEGSSGLMAVISFCLIGFAVGFVNKTQNFLFFLSKEDFLLLTIALVSLLLLLQNEDMLKS